jgi:hypothetical protein
MVKNELHKFKRRLKKRNLGIFPLNDLRPGPPPLSIKSQGTWAGSWKPDDHHTLVMAAYGPGDLPLQAALRSLRTTK